MKSFDHKKESSYLMYFDANSLYSRAMCRPLLVGRFKWVEVKNKDKMLRERKYNFFVECDIKYPKELHKLHNDYPVAPEKMVINDKFKESPYRKTIRKSFKNFII